MQVARSLLALASLGALAIPALSAPADGQGLRNVSADGTHWKGRLSLTTRTSAPWASSLSVGRTRDQRVDSAVVVADYYFAGPATTSLAKGFRASGGVGFARRGASWLGRMPLGANLSSRSNGAVEGDGSTATFPYVGVGYSGIYPKSGWGFTADLGWMGGTSTREGGGAGLNIDGAGAMQPGADSQLAQMRMRPVIQVGVSYSF